MRTVTLSDGRVEQVFSVSLIDDIVFEVRGLRTAHDYVSAFHA